MTEAHLRELFTVLCCSGLGPRPSERHGIQSSPEALVPGRRLARK